MSIDTAGRVCRMIEAYSDNPCGLPALNSGNSYFTAPGADGVVVYRTSGRYLVQFEGRWPRRATSAGCWPGSASSPPTAENG